ncbi:Uncharacterised protein [Pseudomonas luteola]|uniref:TrfB transcriptional repressor protein domain-containing protein n=2 Tax=Pseudomonas luteola TaxID=47886 RepID=A0A2X2BU87_PSELU|nr:Uncharacterised protein [Pseudomonas luteola]SPZ00089.1 Uncharacterised protein [Pseudomonas luteola]
MMAKRAIPRMTQQEFDDVRPKLSGFMGSTVNMAELLIVKGLSLSETAKACNTSAQNVGQAIDRVIAVLEGLPPDWVHISEWMPASLAKEVRKQIKEARKALGQGPSSD